MATRTISKHVTVPNPIKNKTFENTKEKRETEQYNTRISELPKNVSKSLRNAWPISSSDSWLSTPDLCVKVWNNVQENTLQFFAFSF